MEAIVTVRQLEKNDWHPHLARISKILEGKQAEIEVTSLALGSQVQSNWLQLLGLAYDPKDDILEIALDGLDHMIRKPSTIYIDEQPGGLASSKLSLQMASLRCEAQRTIDAAGSEAMNARCGAAMHSIALAALHSFTW
jgi:hypothetical protein